MFEEFLAEHTAWNNWMASMSPLVRVTEVTATQVESGFMKITAKVQNQGYLPTNVTEQAIRNQTAKTVKVSISLDGAELVFGDETVDIGHLAGNRSLPETVEWMIKIHGKRDARCGRHGRVGEGRNPFEVRRRLSTDSRLFAAHPASHFKMARGVTSLTGQPTSPPAQTGNWNSSTTSLRPER